MNKVLFYHLEFPAGGTEKVTINIAKFLSNKNYEIHVMTSNKTQDKNFPYIKNIIEIPNQKSAFDESSAENFLIEYLQQKEIDIFVLPARLAPDLCSQIKKRTKCKIVFCLHSMPLWEVKSLLCSKKERSRRNLYKRIHWYTTTYIKGYWFNSYNRRFIAPYRETYNNVDVFVTLCTDYRNKLKKILHCSGKKIEITSNSEERPSQVNLNKKKQIIYSGRLSFFDKRVDRLLAIWEKCQDSLKDWELIIIGEGEERTNLENLAKKMNLQRLVFAGYISNMEPYYQNASIICLTSNFEGWPLCLTEALSYGVIPISFNCSEGVKTILASEDKPIGILIPPNNLNLFAKELINLANNKNKMEEMRQNIIHRSNLYTSDIIGDKWFTLFNRLQK